MNRVFSTFLLLILSVTVFPVSSDARTWLVRQDGTGDCTTIQAGIDLSSAGDSILVGPGHYYEPLTISGKNVALIGELGATATYIHGTPLHRVIHCVNIPATGVIRGFTITEGEIYIPYWPDNVGGGIFCESSDVEVIDDIITNNHGDGIAADAASVLYVSRNMISYNTGEWAEYGDIFGCGVYCFTSRALIEDNEFVHNENAAVLCQGSSPVVRRNIMRDGSIGIGCFASSQATIYENLIVNGTNIAVAIDHSSPTIRNNTIVANRDGISFFYASPVLENNIIVGSRWGIYNSMSSPSSPILRCNDVWNNSRGNYYSCTPGSGDFSADPLFCNPGVRDYHINLNSQCSPANSGGCGLVGAFGIGCGPTSIQETTWGKIKALFR
ncbi:MAG: right-handed parallel beta-helix repeat-containing protein [Candidatus Eisenbacteria bacterium]|nr:right-handed parallel beta-helix repeat-containing protein [Candidatus Eisenbacteria bacterium]